MGNCSSFSPFSTETKTKQLLVRTGLKFGKGTDANVSIVLHDKNGRKTKVITLDCKFRDDFEHGQADNFPIDFRYAHNDILHQRKLLHISCNDMILLKINLGNSYQFSI